MPPDESIIDRLGLRGRKFFLSVGAGKNKNVNTVTAAFVKAKLDDTSVVLTGYRQSRVNGSYEEVLSDRMTNAGYVSDGELRALYETCFGTCMPLALRGVWPAADRSHGVRLSGHHQQPAGDA